MGAWSGKGQCSVVGARVDSLDDAVSGRQGACVRARRGGNVWQQTWRRLCAESRAHVRIWF